MRAALLLAIAIAMVTVMGCRRDTSLDGQQMSSGALPPPSAQLSAAIANGDYLVQGPVDVVIVPFGWVQIDRDGRSRSIPKAPGDKVHRVPLTGAMSFNDGTAPEQGESLMVASLDTKGPIDADMLARYAQADAGKHVGAKKLYRHAATGDMRGKVLVVRPPPDGRVEIHYLIPDRRRDVWQAVYLVRSDNGERWKTLLAELD